MIMAIVSIGILLMLPSGMAGNLIAMFVALAGILIPDTLPFIDEIVVIYLAIKRLLPDKPKEVDVTRQPEGTEDDNILAEEKWVKWD